MKYSFSTYKMKVEEHEFWVAESNVLKGCIAQAETLDEAIKELELNEIDWLEAAEEAGIPIPSQTIQNPVEYSGKLSLRISKSLHKTVTELSDKDGVSINTFISNAIAEKVGKLNPVITVRHIVKEPISVSYPLSSKATTDYWQKEDFSWASKRSLITHGGN